MTASHTTPNTSRLRHKGPPLGIVATVFVLLFLAGLYPVTAFNGTPVFPGPWEPIGVIMDYFTARPSAVLLCAALQFGASIPLGIFTATVVSRLRFLGVRAAGTDIALARRFAAAGAKVAVNGRDERAVENVAASIRAEGGECIGVRADVTSAAELSILQATIRDRFGEVEVLAAFAGGLGYPVPVLDITEDQWRNTVNTDLTSKFLTVKTFVPSMKEKRSGNIILMSSAAGRLVSQASAAYGAAEAGTLMLMRHLAQELGPFGVRANAIAPSIVRNEKVDKFMPPEIQAKAAESLPLRRIGAPADVAQAALFLASEASSWITGQVLDVNGGKVMI